jgi:hypothetical protein
LQTNDFPVLVVTVSNSPVFKFPYLKGILNDYLPVNPNESAFFPSVNYNGRIPIPTRLLL